MTTLSPLQPETYQVTHRLLLFVAGEQPNSLKARRNLETFCNAELVGRYELQVVDVFTNYKLALAHRILVTPCLVVLAPAPPIMMAGTLQDQEQMRTALRP
jgi:circadian clock protein KaiB